MKMKSPNPDSSDERFFMISVPVRTDLGSPAGLIGRYNFC
ncbi:Uncharacterized protein dnm_082030 [Desulfonema magnum]|uniref:Uncharacterized protein n=1 Tax=Desulfonema magnum TaxID=45655 RepID=A0A975GTG8_9BACT|nr:Uncharacterized protein dnm_082030 [Desulfonema magnum]